LTTSAASCDGNALHRSGFKLGKVVDLTQGPAGSSAGVLPPYDPIWSNANYIHELATFLSVLQCFGTITATSPFSSMSSVESSYPWKACGISSFSS
jgi:hypothetical protein